MNNGWIKLHRRITEWEWFDDHNTFRLFIYLLLTANHEERLWHGRAIKASQRVVSFRKLAEKTGLSLQQIRTCILHLKSTNEITHEGNTKYSLITIRNWSSYQADNTQSNKQPNTQPNNKQEVKKKETIGEEKSSQLKDKETDMGWNNKSDNDDDLPAIDMDTREPERDLEDERKKKVTALIEWAETLRGKKFLDIPTQRKFINDMRAKEISPTVIKQTYSDLLQSEYWQSQESLPDFKTVFSTLKNKK